MSEHTGTIKGISVDYETDKMVISLMFNEKQSAADMYQRLKNVEKLDIKIDKHKKKRSLDANAYCWVLCKKLADVLGGSDTEIYQECIAKYGVSTVKPERKDLVDDLVRMWDGMGIGNSHIIMGDSKLEGYVNVKYFYGSSQYNTAQMAHLLENIIDEAQAQGIDTRSPEEIARMMSLWGERK